MKQLFCALLAACLAVLMLAGCGSTELSAATSAGKTFVLGDTTFNAENDENDINPHRGYSGWACIRYGVGETLFRYSDLMTVEPWLAQGYERLDDCTWRITLRPGIRFSSGRALDAAAVKECLEHLIQVMDRAKNDLDIDHIDADGLTLTITTAAPEPALLNYLSDPYGCIIDLQADCGEGLVAGTGPYRAVELVSGQRLELEPNPYYWNGTPKLDHITVRTISDGDTLTMALQSGEIDAAYGLPYLSYPLFSEGYTVSSTPTSRAFFVWMNFESAPLQDASVRRAIAMGIDKQSFVSALLDGHGYPAAGPYPESFAFGGGSVTAPDYDPEGACRLLESAGWTDTDGDDVREKDGQELVLRWLTYPSRQELPLLAESAQAMLGKLGIRVEVNCTASHNTLRTDPSGWDLYASAMVTAPTGDPEYFFASCCLEDSPSNIGHYHSDRLEALADELAVTFDPDRRSQLAVEMQQVLLDDDAYVFCSHLQMSLIAREGVTGLIAHPCDYYEITVDLDVE